MVVPTELTSSESSEFLAMIQQMISCVSSFTGCSEFVLKSSIPLLEGLDMCHPTHPICIFCSLLLCLEFLLHCIILLHMMISLDT